MATPYINFEQSPNILSGGTHLIGSLRMYAGCREIKKRLCSTCKNELPKNRCSKNSGKITNPDCWYCSWWERKSNGFKRCNTCGKLKSINKFYKNRANPDGYQNKCIKCSLAYSAEYQRISKRV